MTGCVCYVIDKGYILPTFVSAIQSRRSVSSDIASIVVILVEDDMSIVEKFGALFAEYSVILIGASRRQIAGMHTMYGRLFIAEICGRDYSRIVYLDGDTQIRGDLSPLFICDIPAGKFLAVRDASEMFARLSPAWRSQLTRQRQRNGVVKIEDYFNSGVMVADTETWKHISDRTIAHIRSTQRKYEFGDQDPLNEVVGDGCVYISNKWNFPGFLIGSPMERISNPIVYHMLSDPKPWTHSGLPWGRKWYDPYSEMMERHPILYEHAKKTHVSLKVRYHLQQFYKYFTEYRRVGHMTELPTHVIE